MIWAINGKIRESENLKIDPVLNANLRVDRAGLSTRGKFELSIKDVHSTDKSFKKKEI